MLFVIVMDVLSSLVDRAETWGLLKPLTASAKVTRLSLYADDVVLFATTHQTELSTIRQVFECFGQASGLNTNLAKSYSIPIKCEEQDVLDIRQAMPCDIRSFPCKYLGLPLAVGRLSKADLQPIIDKVGDALPGWKASLLAKSGRLVLVKAVLMAIPLHVLIALNVPKWFIKAIDKFRRGFLWKGKAEAKGGHCPISWEQATRPLQFGGLGIHCLEKLAWALRMRWLWLQKTEPHRPWTFSQVHVPQQVMAMFRVSVHTTVGDRRNTLF